MPAGDRLSILPDELLHHILSFIPSTNFISHTSLLSKRWRHLWTHHPNLHFKMPYPENFSTFTVDEIKSVSEPYIRSVDRCLDSFASPNLDSFSVHLWLPSYRSELKANSKVADRWLRFAGLRSARKLSIWARAQPHGWYARIPCSIFSCLSLSELHVSCSAFPEIPGKFKGFKNLTSLYIGIGSISNDAVAGLLEGCPLLEDLKLIGLIGLSYIKISSQSSPRLKRLVLLSYYLDDQWIGSSIEAPNLTSFHFGGDVSDLVFKGSPALNEAHVTMNVNEGFVGLEDWMKIVDALSNVRVLSVNHWFYQFIIPKGCSGEPLFKNLKEFHCDIDWVTRAVLRSLAYGLGECLFLEKLLLNLSDEERTLVKDSVQKDSGEGSEDASDGPDGYIWPPPPYRHTEALLKRVEDEYELDEWNPFEHLGKLDYYLRHLKVITVKGLLGSKNEMRLLKFLLAKAIALEKFVVFDHLTRDEQQLQVIFADIPRSSHVQMKLSLYDNLQEELY